MRRQMGKRERERKRRQRSAEIERDAGMLPTDGPIADVVARIGADLDRCVTAGSSAAECAAVLRPLGLKAFALVGSIRGLRAVGWKSAHRGAGQPEMRTSLIDAAWNGIGDGRGLWISRKVQP